MTQDEWDILEKDFLNEMMVYWDDLYSSILKLREVSKNYENPFARSQLCIALIAIDTFARFNLIFQGIRDEGLERNNEKRFKNWIDSFLLNDENEVFVIHKEKFKMDSDSFWKLRNSLLHFYSFPKSMGGTKIGFVFNVDNREHRKVVKLLKERGHKVKFIDVHQLIQAIFTGFTLQMAAMQKMIEESPEKYIDNVKYAYAIIKNENMKTIVFDKDMKLIS
jgi:hypothetical protein